MEPKKDIETNEIFLLKGTTSTYTFSKAEEGTQKAPITAQQPNQGCTRETCSVCYEW